METWKTLGIGGVVMVTGGLLLANLVAIVNAPSAPEAATTTTSMTSTSATVATTTSTSATVATMLPPMSEPLPEPPPPPPPPPPRPAAAPVEDPAADPFARRRFRCGKGHQWEIDGYGQVTPPGHGALDLGGRLYCARCFQVLLEERGASVTVVGPPGAAPAPPAARRR